MEKIAYYLPQFHEHKNNSQFWGDKFTDWVTTSAAKPLFTGHKQPLQPGQLGYYDLKKEPSMMEQQFKIAAKMGLTGFSFYHYRFSETERALDDPIKSVRNSDLDIRYMLTWVNCDWTKSWIGQDNVVIHKQTYSYDDIEVFADELCYYFSDTRYIRVVDRPVLQIHHPKFLISLRYLEGLRNAILKRGFDPYLIAPEPHYSNNFSDIIDAVVAYPPGDLRYQANFQKLKWGSIKLLRKSIKNNPYLKDKLFKFLNVLDYEGFMTTYNEMLIAKSLVDDTYIPNFLSGWDNTPRYGLNGLVLDNYNPSALVSAVEHYVKRVPNISQRKLIFFKAWNEWAEGNVLEPCSRFDGETHDELRRVLENI